MRVPRKTKNAIKNAILTYDISSCPKGIDITRLFYIFETTGCIIYDSRLGGDKPSFNNRSFRRLKIIDTTNESRR